MKKLYQFTEDEIREIKEKVKWISTNAELIIQGRVDYHGGALNIRETTESILELMDGE